MNHLILVCKLSLRLVYNSIYPEALFADIGV